MKCSACGQPVREPLVRVHYATGVTVQRLLEAFNSGDQEEILKARLWCLHNNVEVSVFEND